MAGSYLHVDLSGWAQPFERWCSDRGKKRSVALRELIAQAVGGVPDSANVQAAAPLPRSQVGGARPQHIHVRLNGADCETLRRQAAAAGLPAAHYLATVLRAVQEGRTSIAGKDAVEALAQSNYQLSWLGRNLKALARKLDGMPGQASPPDWEELRELIAQLHQHLARAALVLADIESTRWHRHKGRRPQRKKGPRSAEQDAIS